MMLIKTLLASLTIVMAATSSDCSNWFQVTEDDDYPITLTSKSVTGSQTDVLSPKFSVLDTQSELDDFLATIPTRTNSDVALPAYDASDEKRVGIISAAKSCEFTPVLKEVVETKDVVQVKILNEKVTTTDCEPLAQESYRYFIVVFDNKDKPVTVLTEDTV